MKEYKKILSNCLLFLFLAATFILPANAALQAVGPISTANGFPVWYQDTNGLAVQLCLGINPDGTGLMDPNCVAAPKDTFIDPVTGVPKVTFDPALPVSFPTNWPQEAFYWIADAVDAGAAPLTVGTGGVKATFRMVLEGALIGTPDVNGIVDPAAPDTIKTTFLRLNLRIPTPSLLTPSSTFTATYPFGTFNFTTDAVGNVNKGLGGQAFRANDGCAAVPGGAACDFTIPLPAATTHIGPFLKAVTPAPPPGYLGNFLVTQTITPGPSGANFSITGPNIGGAGINTIQTNLWKVAGKIAAIDTIPPVIVSARPALVLLGSTNVVLNADITDNLGVFGATVDLGPFGNNLTAALNGAQEVPPTPSTATGSGTFTIDTAANILNFSISFAGLSGAPTDAHIHGPAPPGANANILFSLTPLGLASPITGTWNYPEANEADILAGNTYVNIHTLLFPAGEIRGQILPTSNVQNMVLIAGNRTNGTWGVVIGNVTRAGTFILPIAATDGSNTTALNFTFTVTNVPAVKAVPNIVIVNNTTSVTVTVTQGLQLVSNAAVDLTGVPLPAPLTNITDASGNATFSVSPIAQGIINVTANSPTFPNPATTTIIASPTGVIIGDVNANAVVDVVDGLFTLQAVAGLRTLTPLQTAAADVNANGAIDVGDGLFILQAVAGLRVL